MLINLQIVTQNLLKIYHFVTVTIPLIRHGLEVSKTMMLFELIDKPYVI